VRKNSSYTCRTPRQGVRASRRPGGTPLQVKFCLTPVEAINHPSLSRTRDRIQRCRLPNCPGIRLRRIRRHLYLLARRDPQIVARGPDLIVDQHLERDRSFAIPHQRHVWASTQSSGNPRSQVKPHLASQENDIAKTTSRLTSIWSMRGAPGALASRCLSRRARCWRARHCRLALGRSALPRSSGGFCPGNACACGTGSGCAGSSYAVPIALVLLMLRLLLVWFQGGFHRALVISFSVFTISTGAHKAPLVAR